MHTGDVSWSPLSEEPALVHVDERISICYIMRLNEIRSGVFLSMTVKRQPRLVQNNYLGRKVRPSLRQF
jgi:hypothetical protein